MSTAAADAGAAPKKGLPKKLMIILLAVVLVVVAGGGAAVYFMKKKAADAEAAEEDGGSHAAAKSHADPKAPPTFVPLDAFTVNLADRDSERFAQIAVTLELADPHVAEQLKLYMPAIRDGVLMILSHKTSAELLERAGKEKLAREIGLQAARAMGYEVEDEDEDEDAAAKHKADDEEEAPKSKKKKKKKRSGDENPIKHVLFANFIIQ